MAGHFAWMVATGTSTVQLWWGDTSSPASTTDGNRAPAVRPPVDDEYIADTGAPPLVRITPAVSATAWFDVAASSGWRAAPDRGALGHAAVHLAALGVADLGVAVAVAAGQRERSSGHGLGPQGVDAEAAGRGAPRRRHLPGHHAAHVALQHGVVHGPVLARRAVHGAQATPVVDDAVVGLAEPDETAGVGARRLPRHEGVEEAAAGQAGRSGHRRRRHGGRDQGPAGGVERRGVPGADRRRRCGRRRRSSRRSRSRPWSATGTDRHRCRPAWPSGRCPARSSCGAGRRGPGGAR